MKKMILALFAAVMLLTVCVPAMAVNEDVEGELVIYTSMYPFVIDMMNEAIQKEFPNLVPGIDGSFFFQSGSGKLITKMIHKSIYQSSAIMACCRMNNHPLRLIDYDNIIIIIDNIQRNILRFNG